MYAEQQEIKVEMEGNGMMINNDMKVDVNSTMGSSGGLARQGSITKSTNCLCSPTTHAGSFRCRLHRVPSGGLQRTRSVDATAVGDQSHSKAEDVSGHGHKEAVM
ncbi:hypothetical protein Leryth_016182 [Lithospermum erythrorhizon]|nr:hypothetical protein Leryth_016182 [Lithospermum erythrorhizon]